MPINTTDPAAPYIPNLETRIVSKGYTITKKYDGIKGICTVTITRSLTGTTITDANRSNMPLWNAYRRALELVLDQLDLYEKMLGKNI
jgi:hypothetical protein